MESDPRYGVFHNYAREDYELPCRNCGKIVVEASVKCSQCGTPAPGIYSECPTCYSKNYIWKYYGIHYSAAIAGLIILGPLGAGFFALKGRTEAECVCLNCGQGWMPFAFPGGKWSATRKFRLKKTTLPQNNRSSSEDILEKKKSCNKSSNNNFLSKEMIGVVKSYDVNAYIGEIDSGGKIYEMIFNATTKFHDFPKGYPLVGNKVIFISQKINEKLYASDIEFYNTAYPRKKIGIVKSDDLKTYTREFKKDEFVIVDRYFVWGKGVAVSGCVPSDMLIRINDRMKLVTKEKIINVTIQEINISNNQYDEAIAGDYVELILNGVLSEIDIEYKDILRHK